MATAGLKKKDDKVQIIMGESKETKNVEKWENKSGKITVLCIFIAVVFSTVALILSIVGVANKGANEYYITTGETGGMPQTANTANTPVTMTTNNVDSDKVWLFQIGHYQSNTQYLDETSGTIKGYNVDIVNGVCQIANKHCELVNDLSERCWTSEAGQRGRGGIGLMGGWYDGCVGWVNTYDRARSYRFTNEFAKLPDIVLVTSRDDITSLPDFTGLRVGFLDGWATDEHCLARYTEIENFDQNDPAQVIHFPKEVDMFNAVKAEEVDVAFAPKFTYLEKDANLTILWIPERVRCFRSGLGIMMRKDQLYFQSWWNDAFDRLKSTGQYEDICNRLSTAHGDQPGRKPEEVCVGF